MNTPTPHAAADTPAYYRVEDLHVDVGRRCVTRGETALAVAGISFDLLLTLLRAAPNVVSIDELMERVWPGLVVSAETVSQRVKIVRRALGDDADRPRYIAGVRGRGYHMLAAVEPLLAPGQGEGIALPVSVVPTPADLATDNGVLPTRKQVANPSRWIIAAMALLALLAIGFFSRSVWREPTGSVRMAPSGSVAVLPFANLTGDASKDYLGEGMAEEVINTLTKVQGLKVPARTSSFAYKGRNTDIRQIAKDLGVGTILEGSVRSAGERIRITAQLINAEDGLHLWSETYDEQFSDLFKLQDKLATAIVQALQVNLNGAASATVTQAPPTKNVEAYRLYLQGYSLLSRTTIPDVARAIDYFRQAIALDPKFARAYAGMAMANMEYSFADPGASTKRIAEGARAAQQALALDPNNAEALLALGSARGLQTHSMLPIATNDRLVRALVPNDGSVRMVLASHRYFFGHGRDALEEARTAYALAPANALVVAGLAYIESEQQHYTEALRDAELASNLGYEKTGPLLWPVYWRESLRARRYSEAAEVMLTGLRLQDSKADPATELIRLIYAALADPNKRTTAIAARGRLFSPQQGGAAGTAVPRRGSRNTSETTACFASSSSYVLMNAIDAADEVANRCLDQMASAAVPPSTLSLFSPELVAWRRDPRFQAFAARWGLMDYWQQYGPPDDCDLQDGKLSCR